MSKDSTTQKYIEERKKNDPEFKKIMDLQELAFPYAMEIISLRDKTGISQLELAKLINVSEEDIIKWEDCEEIPSAEILNRIANSLHKPVNIVINPLVAHG